MKHMFDIFEKLIGAQSDEIYELVMKKSSVSRTRRFTYFQILCYAFER